MAEERKSEMQSGMFTPREKYALDKRASRENRTSSNLVRHAVLSYLEDSDYEGYEPVIESN